MDERRDIRCQVERNITHPATMPHSRTRTGCLTCREDGYKCDEGRPHCGRCVRLHKVCRGYGVVVRWRAWEAPSEASSSSRVPTSSPPSSSSSPKATTSTRTRRRSRTKRAPSTSPSRDTPPEAADQCTLVAVNPSYVPVDVDPETRFLLHHWTVTLAALVSMTPTCSGTGGGRQDDNPFLIHLTPMIFRSAALSSAIASMAASHLAVLRSDSSMETTASKHRLRAVSCLRRTIETEDPELSLAAILMLQSADRLFTADTRVDHLSGAKAVISQGQAGAARGSGPWSRSSARFLLGLCYYQDVLSSVSRGMRPLLDLDDDPAIVTGEGLPRMEGLTSVLRLVGMISRMQDHPAPGSDEDQAAAAVRVALELGMAMGEAVEDDGDHDDDCELDDVGHTTRAYQHAAFIYLYRVVASRPATTIPETLPHQQMILEHARRCLFHLAQVPVASPLVSAHTWPLWTAACESVDEVSRLFARARLDAMFAARCLPSLRRLKQDVEEVWRIKDAQRGLLGEDNVDCVKFILQSRQREADLA